MKTVVLIDDSWAGHHPTYFKFFAKTLLELDYCVVAFCPQPQELADWVSENCPALGHNFYTATIQPPPSSRFPIAHLRSTFTALRRWQIARQAIQSSLPVVGTPPDLVFFAWLDNYLGRYLVPAAIATMFPYNWSGLFFQPPVRKQLKFSQIRIGFLNPLSLLTSQFCKNVAVLDEGSMANLQKKLSKQKIVVFPDFADCSLPNSNYELVAQIEQKARGRKIVGLLGSIEKRKGVMTLIEVARQLDRKDYFFVFAGALSTDFFTAEEVETFNAFVRSQPDNCLFHLARIPDEASFNALVDECDILFAAYENFLFSSNILTKAAIFQKLVIVSKYGCMDERIQQFQLGYAIAEANVGECIAILERLYEQLTASEREIAPNFEEYKRLHSVCRLPSAFQEILTL